MVGFFIFPSRTKNLDHQSVSNENFFAISHLFGQFRYIYINLSVSLRIYWWYESTSIVSIFLIKSRSTHSAIFCVLHLSLMIHRNQTMYTILNSKTLHRYSTILCVSSNVRCFNPYFNRLSTARREARIASSSSSSSSSSTHPSEDGSRSLPPQQPPDPSPSQSQAASIQALLAEARDAANRAESQLPLIDQLPSATTEPPLERDR